MGVDHLLLVCEHLAVGHAVALPVLLEELLGSGDAFEVVVAHLICVDHQRVTTSVVVILVLLELLVMVFISLELVYFWLILLVFFASLIVRL